MPQKKKYFTLLLVLLALAAVTSGIYLFVSPKINNSPSYSVNKYSDTVNWCNTNLNEGILTVECKALLINIGTDNCFDVQIITKDKELKDLNVCESGDTLTYENEVLNYKILMPVDIVFTYSRANVLDSYTFMNVSFTKLDNSYVQEAVNEGITNLVSLSLESTTIENSGDFCPKPDTLPDYVTDTNRQAYTEFFNKNIMGKEKYIIKYMYNWDDSIIRLLFACDSSENMGYTEICDKRKVQGLEKLANDIPALTAIPNWDKTTMDEKDEAILKEISLIYDSMFLRKQQNDIVNLARLGDLTNIINSNQDMNENVFCNLKSLYTILSKEKPFFARDENFIVEKVNDNYKKIHSSACFAILNPDHMDPNGLVILHAQNNNDITEGCINLSRIIK